jgi:membrane associated rhomboid family serine protease
VSDEAQRQLQLGGLAMFPIGDDDSARRSLPVVTYGLIALNVLFYFVQLNGGETFLRQWAFTPARFSRDPAADWPTIFSAMFMHGGWLHLGGNMLYLWIFGDNVEDVFGPVKFLIFYLVCGIAATFAQYYVNPGSRIPNVGASGAIAGVLGGYLWLFPHARVRVLVYNQIVAMPAIVVLGLWIVLQFLSYAGTLGQRQDVGGVAFMAHIGGFVVGLALTFLLAGGQRRGPWEGA